MEQKTKVCLRCEEEKPIESFYEVKNKLKDGSVSLYRECQCKSCRNRLKYLRIKGDPAQHAKFLEKGRMRVRKKYHLNPELSHQRVKAYIQKKIKDGTFKANWLWNKYKITIDEYTKLAENQDYKCIICNRSVEEIGKPLVIDHCHTTGQVRGLLCSNCNTGIGLLKESKENLQRAVEYLQK